MIGTSNYTLSVIHKKELEVDYSKVLVGVVVEQALVGLAGINTSQKGAQFRPNDKYNTKFHLNF